MQDLNEVKDEYQGKLADMSSLVFEVAGMLQSVMDQADSLKQQTRVNDAVWARSSQNGVYRGRQTRFSEGGQKINPKTKLWHIWPNNSIYFFQEYETLEANLENERII